MRRTLAIRHSDASQEEYDMNNKLFARCTLIALGLAAIPGVTVAAAAEPSTLRVEMGAQRAPAIPDLDITRKVAAALAADQKLVGTTIDVSTRQGVVTLNGKLDSVPMIYRAVELTRRIEGVKDVDDRELIKI